MGKRTALATLLPLLLAAGLALGSCAEAAAPDGIRPPVVAGRFYPADPERLERALTDFLASARPAAGPRPLAIVAPHAGYVYSGQIAADAYRQAADHEVGLVVILGANHTTAGFDGVSVYTGTGYRTPLGVAEIDTTVTAALLAADAAFTFRPEVHQREHSVEVQVPFVQHVFPGARIVAAVVGWPDPDLCARFGRAVARAVAGRRVLVVASTDLSHYPSHDDADRVDRRTLAALASLDPTQFQRVVREQERQSVPGLATCACGEAPALAAMTAAKELGATRGRIVSYANSGDTAVGDLTRVVGYGAMTMCAEPQDRDAGRPDGTRPEATGEPQAEAGIVDREGQRQLLALARETIARTLASDTAPLARDFPAALQREQGAFVTLRKQGELRGCIGRLSWDMPLHQSVAAMALKAAFEDPRFAPLRTAELAEIEIEISALTPTRPVAHPEEIVVGRHGVILRKSGRSAVFLPQVATEQRWDRPTLLDQLCRKAGLPAGEWREGAELLVFEAQVFGEAEFR